MAIDKSSGSPRFMFHRPHTSQMYAARSTFEMQHCLPCTEIRHYHAQVFVHRPIINAGQDSDRVVADQSQHNAAHRLENMKRGLTEIERRDPFLLYARGEVVDFVARDDK